MSHQETDWSKYWANDLLIKSQQDRFKRAMKSTSICTFINGEYLTAEISGKSEVYKVQPHKCSCADFRVNKLPCKHMYQLALEMDLLNGDLELPDVDNRFKPRYVGPAFSDNFRYKKKTNQELENLASSRAVILDTETTGMSFVGRISDGHEILQLAIIDDRGTLIHNQYYKPKDIFSWEEAQAIHGISPDLVQDAPALSDHQDKIQQIFDTCDYIGIYNANFDIAFLQDAGFVIEDQKVLCLMRQLTVGNQSFMPLDEQAERYGYQLSNAHNALDDCYAALACYDGLKSNIIGKQVKSVETPNAIVKNKPQIFLILFIFAAMVMFASCALLKWIMSWF